MIQTITVLVIAALVVVDQLIKIAVLKYLEPIGSVPCIPKVIRLTYVENTGAAFGSFSRYTELLSIFTAIVICVLLFYLLSGKLKIGFPYVSLTMVASGGIGNLIDRIFRGYVIDYIEPIFVRFAVFNFADMLVTVGATILIIYLLYDTFREHKAQKQKTEQKDE